MEKVGRDERFFTRSRESGLYRSIKARNSACFFAPYILLQLSERTLSFFAEVVEHRAAVDTDGLVGLVVNKDLT